jgi:hypothetical protein
MLSRTHSFVPQVRAEMRKMRKLSLGGRVPAPTP